MADGEARIVGRLGSDPDLRFTNGGKAVCSVGVAVSRRWKQNNEWQEETTWWELTCWESLAENVAASLSKGDRVIAWGRVSTDEYTSREGEKRTKLVMVADTVGADLRWARATVERTVREQADRGETHRDGPVYGDEEPF